MPTRRVAVILVSLRYDGGAETLLRTLIDELADEPYDLEVFTLRNVSHERGEHFRTRGIAVRSFPARRLVSMRRFLRLLRSVRAGRFDVIHTNLPPANILGMFCGLLLRIPVVVTLHNTETKADRHWYQGRLETFMLQHLATRVIAVGDRTADARRRLLKNTDVHVLHNAVAPTPPLEPDELWRLRHSIMTNSRNRLVITVGRLASQKAHDDLLRAFATVRSTHDDVELAIVGRGARLDELTRLVDELGLGGAAHLLGMRHDVRHLLQASDVFVLSSHWEGLPVALLEAMEAGLPVVSTRVGDVAEVLDGGDGRLVEPGDVAALASAITESLASLAETGGDANRRVVEERYSSHAWATTMSRHYDEAIDHRRSA